MALKDLKDSITRAAYGMTAAEAKEKGICISCKKPPTFYSEVGRKEYGITALCEPCFDEITRETELEE
jgi:hypothetical protein